MTAPQPSPGGRTAGLIQVVKRSFPPILALAGLAVAQPLLDLFGRNPEFFVASDMTSWQIVIFSLAITFLLPAVGLLLVLVVAASTGREGPARVATDVLVALFAGLLGLRLSRQLGFDRTLVAGALAAGLAVAVLMLRRRLPRFDEMVRYLALAPIGFLALFLLTSESSDLLFVEEATAARDVEVGRPAPIVVIVLDEVPTASLMRPDGSLNDDRFPNFARLAADATWYRGATSVAPFTPNAVPSILDGDLPREGVLPVSADHPDNLFTMLGSRYDLDVTETITDLCPSSLCPDDVAPTAGGFVSRARRSLTDAVVVYGHATLPRRFRLDLPAIDQSWGEFTDDTSSEDDVPDVDDPASSGSSEVTSNDFLFQRIRAGTGRTSDIAGETLRQAIANSSVVGDDDLLFVHEVFPHRPWTRTQTGRIYANRPAPSPGSGPTWRNDNEFLVTQALQRHLLQVGYADRILGEMIDKLQTDGVWDDALVVVTADHGMAFDRDDYHRQPTTVNLHSIYNVPMFIKEPGGEGRIDDLPARTIDVLPTIVDLLDISTGMTFDGASLVGPDRATDSIVVHEVGPKEVGGGLSDTIAIAEANALRLPAGDDWRAVAAPGPYAALIGDNVDDYPDGPGASRSWSVDQAAQLRDLDLDQRKVPIILAGEITEPAGAGASYLLALNGTIAGVVGFEDIEGRPGQWSSLLDETAFVRGVNQVELLIVTGPASDPTIRSAGGPSSG